MDETGIVARAFELARSGTYGYVAILKAMKREGFTEASIERHLGGQSIRRQLRDAYMPSPEVDQQSQQGRP